MSNLRGYALMAEQHWRQHRPKLVQELEGRGALAAALHEAEERTLAEMERLMKDFKAQGQTPQQAHDQAWEILREKYILLPPEESPATGTVTG